MAFCSVSIVYVQFLPNDLLLSDRSEWSGSWGIFELCVVIANFDSKESIRSFSLSKSHVVYLKLLNSLPFAATIHHTNLQLTTYSESL